MRGGALHQVALVLRLLAVGVVEGQLAGDLAAAFLDLLVEAGGAAGLGVEAGLEAVDDREQHVHGADGVGGGRNLHHVARCWSRWKTAVPAVKTRQSTVKVSVWCCG